MPQDWMQWRIQWEFTHAGRFVLQLLGLCTLVFSALEPLSEEGSGGQMN